MDFNTTLGANDSIIDENITDSGGYTHSSSSFFFSFGLIFIPGILTNGLAMFFMIRDMKKAAFPAIILIFFLCSTNLSAVIFSLIKHTVNRYVTDISFSTCACLSVPHNFFRMYGGVINAMMAADRVLAICRPFYYKKHIEVTTWKIGCFIAAFSTFCFSMFPIIGLGDVMTTVTKSTGDKVFYCSNLGYRTEPVEKIYGFLYAAAGFLVVIIIVSGNALVIRSILRLNSRIVSFRPSSASSFTMAETGDNNVSNNASKVTTFEIAFAKLMGCLAVVYLICEVPYHALVLLQQFDVKSSGMVTTVVHFLGGLSYSCDPIVYILIRKVNFRRIFRCLCHCRRGNDDMVKEQK